MSDIHNAADLVLDSSVRGMYGPTDIDGTGVVKRKKRTGVTVLTDYLSNSVVAESLGAVGPGSIWLRARDSKIRSRIETSLRS